MYKRDYLERLVEEGAKVIARLLGLRKEGRVEKALQVADEAFEMYTGYTYAQIDDITLDTFTNFIEDSGIAPQRLELMAWLLVEKEALHTGTGQEQGASPDNYRKSLLILEHLNKTQPHTFSLTRHQKIAEVKAIIAERS